MILTAQMEAIPAFELAGESKVSPKRTESWADGIAKSSLLPSDETQPVDRVMQAPRRHEWGTAPSWVTSWANETHDVRADIRVARLAIEDAASQAIRWEHIQAAFGLRLTRTEAADGTHEYTILRRTPDGQYNPRPSPSHTASYRP